MFRRFARLWRRATTLVQDEPEAAATAAPLPTLGSDLEAAGLSVRTWCDVNRSRRVFYSSITSDALDGLRRRDGERVRQTIRAA